MMIVWALIQLQGKSFRLWYSSGSYGMTVVCYKYYVITITMVMMSLSSSTFSLSLSSSSSSSPLSSSSILLSSGLPPLSWLLLSSLLSLSLSSLLSFFNHYYHYYHLYHYHCHHYSYLSVILCSAGSEVQESGSTAITSPQPVHLCFICR